MVRAAIAGVLLGFAITIVLVVASRPYCPQEDSCTADYRHGGWHITESEH